MPDCESQRRIARSHRTDVTSHRAAACRIGGLRGPRKGMWRHNKGRISRRATTHLSYGRPPMTTTLYTSIATTTATTIPIATRYRPKKYATTAAHAPTAAISPPVM